MRLALMAFRWVDRWLCGRWRGLSALRWKLEERYNGGPVFALKLYEYLKHEWLTSPRDTIDLTAFHVNKNAAEIISLGGWDEGTE